MSDRCSIEAGLSEDELKSIADVSTTNEINAESVATAKKIVGDSKLSALLEVERRLEALEMQAAHPKGLTNGLLGFMLRDRHGLQGGFVKGRINEVRGMAHRIWLSNMEKLKTSTRGNLAGLFGANTKTKEQLNLLNGMVKHLNGEKASADAISAADTWLETVNYLRTRLANSLGVRAEILEDWKLPQVHDQTRIMNATREVWVSGIRDKLDFNRMNLDGKTPEEVTTLLNEIYETVSTGGLAKLEGRGAQKGDTSITGKYKRRRVLHFKDAASWIEYNDAYGTKDLFKTMTDHIDNLSKDIGLTETMGPNPRATFEHMALKAQQAAKKKGETTTAEAVFDLISGAASDEPGRIAKGLSSIRNWQVATKLQSSFLASVTDHPLMALAASHNGMPVFDSMKRYLQTVSRAKDSKKTAVQMLLSAEHCIDRGLAGHDFSKNLGGAYSQNAAEFTMKAGLTAPHTEIARAAWGTSYMFSLSNDSGKLLKQLSKKRQARFKEYGISNEDWEIIRSTGKVNIQGENFIDPANIPVKQRAKYVGMVTQEIDTAIPMANELQSAILHMGTKSGGLGGEVIRSATQFKSHPIAIMHTHYYRAMSQQTTGGKIAYTASMVGMLTAFGAIAVQAKEISKGNTTMDWDSPTLWANAFRVGGGLGLFGDFIMSNGVSGYGNSISQQIAGPTFTGPVQALAEIVAYGNLKKIYEGDYSGVNSDAADFLVNNLPLVKLFYIKAAFERGMVDSAKSMLDSGYQRKADKRIRKARSESGQEAWWEPGEALPEALK